MSLKGHTSKVHACAFAPDGSLLASASADTTLRLWDPGTGREFGILGQHLAEVHSCAFAPDMAFLVSVSGEKTVKLLEPSIREDWRRSELMNLQGHVGGLSDCAVAPDGSFFISASWHGPPLQSWNPSSGKKLRTFVARNALHRVEACAVAPDASFVLSAGRDYWVNLWAMRTGKETHVLMGHRGPVLDCAISSDGDYVVSASQDATLKIWDPVTGDETTTLNGHREAVTGCAVTPDGSSVVSVSADRTLRVWDPIRGEVRSTLPLTGALTCVGVHPFLPIAAAGDEGGSIHLIDLVGIEYGPIVVTAVRRSGESTIRCPNCWEAHPLDEGWLGRVIDCPTSSCNLHLRVNPFVAGQRRRGLFRRIPARS